MDGNTESKMVRARFSKGALLLLVCIIFYAFNLRAPIVAVGPVLPDIARELMLTPAMAGLITGIPLVCFSLLSMFVPVFSERLGLGKFLFYSILILAAGMLVRSAGGTVLLFAGSALIGLGITIGNVLMPAFIKKKFPRDVGLVTAIYLAAMNLMSVFAVGFSISMGFFTGLGWRGSIGIWVLLSAGAIVLWFPFAHKNGKRGRNKKTGADWFIWKSKLAWQISVFMGTQSVVFYVLAAWLPNILQDWGMTPVLAGWMLSVFQMGQAPMTFIGPLWVGRMKDQTRIIWFIFILLVTGLVMIIVWKIQLIIPAMLLMGISVGLAFAVATMFLVIRTDSITASAGLSGMAQSIGYFMAACAPPFFGALFGWTGSWMIPLLSLFTMPLLLLFTGLASAKDRQVKSST